MGADAQVVWAEPNYLRQTTTIDSELWAFYNPGGLTISFTRGRYKGDVVDQKISKPDADEDNVEGYGSNGAAVTIASLDTGVDFDHAEFEANPPIPGWDYYSNDPDPSDENDHGTHTTGTMAGQSVGVAGVSGAGANVQVIVYRVCGSLGCPTSAIALAIRAAAADAGVVAMNLSLSGSSESDAEKDAIAYAVNDESGEGPALVIASAGNGGTGTVRCPACDDNAISVAASNWSDELTYYSNWGPGLDITAPGGEMYSNTTAEGGIWSSVRGNGYAYFQGTSMAAPQVTGTAGVVASMNLSLRGSDLRARILGTTDDVGDVLHFGNGRLNSYRAVTGNTLDEGASSPPPNQPPTANDDAASTTEGSAVTIDVLANDTDPDNDALSVTSASNPSYGTAAVNANNTVTYTPAASFTESDSFEYHIADGNGGAATATVTVTVNAAGPGPTVTECEPNFGVLNQKLPVEVMGSNFVSGATVDFGQRIAVQDVTWVTTTVLRVLIKIQRRASVGLRAVRVTNPDGQSGEGLYCFNVVR
jgi:hypothetical protein